MSSERSSVRNLFSSAILLAALLAAGVAHGVCTVSTTPVAFGSYDPFLASPVNSTGSISVSCDEAPPPDITVQIGASPTSGAFIPRQMKQAAGTELLNYNLYVDAAMLTVWGDGSPGTATLTDKVRKNKPWVPTVWARIPPGQDLPAGLYSETLTVTILP